MLKVPVVEVDGNARFGPFTSVEEELAVEKHLYLRAIDGFWGGGQD
jgi:hypothetical protein